MMRRLGVRQGVTSLAARLLLALSPTAHAQTAQPIPPVAQSQPALIPYLNPAYGFQLDLPAAWTYDRTSFPGPTSAIGVLRGRAVLEPAAMQVLVFRMRRPVALADWATLYARVVGEDSGTDQVRVTLLGQGPRPEAILSVEGKVGADLTHTLYYCVPLDQQMILVITVARSLADDADVARAETRRAFEELTGSMRILYTPQRADELRSAVKRGAALLREKLRLYTPRVGPNEAQRFYELRVDGAAVGYLSQQFTIEVHPTLAGGAAQPGKSGLRVREHSWRFSEDGAALLTTVDLFCSSDLRSDLTEITTMQIPSTAAADAPVVVTRDQCIREDDTLFTSFRSSVEPGLPDPRAPLALDESYLGLAWVRILPGLLGLRPAPPAAFTTYDVDTRALTLSMFEPLGEVELPDVPGTKAFGFRRTDGFSPHVAMLYTDEFGALLRLDSGAAVVLRRPSGVIEEQFAQRREAARRRASLSP